MLDIVYPRQFISVEPNWSDFAADMRFFENMIHFVLDLDGSIWVPKLRFHDAMKH